MKSPLKNIVLPLALAAGCTAILVLALAGCQSSPDGWESKFFNIQTNVTPQLVTQTNAVWITNTVDRLETNWVAGIPSITVRPETSVTSETEVTFGTNNLVTYTYTANTNAAAVGQTAGGIANLVMPGAGGIVTTAIGGLVALWAGLRSRRMSKNAGVLAQGIEIYGEVVKGMGPLGSEVDGRVKRELQKHQAEANVLQDVLKILANTVDNSDAQKSAVAIREFMTPATLVETQAPKS